jgi:hypothetical protein
MSETVIRLRENKLTTFEKFLCYVASPLVSALHGLFFMALLTAHRVVDQQFNCYLKHPHLAISFYDHLSVGTSIATTIITILGIYFCYRANKQGDGRDFTKRVACFSLPINLRIFLLLLSFLEFVAGFSLSFLKQKLHFLKHTFFNTNKQLLEK